MFNNAGTAIIGPVKRHSIEDWNHVIDVNLRGVINGIHSSYQVMLKQGFGHIVNTASIFGLVPQAGASAYTTTKHAVVGISNCLRAEASPEGIRVSVLCPGAIRTPILQRGEASVKWLTDKQFDRSDIERRSKEAQKHMDPNVFASKALNAIAKNKAVIIESASYKSLWWGYRISHSFGISFARKLYQDRLRKFFD